MKHAIALLLLLAGASNAIACSCFNDASTLEEAVTNAFDNATAVVLATAEQVENLEPFTARAWSEGGKHEQKTYYNLQRTQFVALQSWKGEHGKRFFTDIVIACCMCGYTFEQGQTYLLYLHGPDNNGYYRTSSCSRTSGEPTSIEADVEVFNKLGFPTNN